MSELSTVAIKDGHRGHPHHHHGHPAPFANLDTERADRISRLPGLERLTNVRQNSNSSLPPGASASHPQGYFDSTSYPPQAKERSTVGSASATGSVGGRTTWASGSDQADAGDNMTEDMETSSMGGGSDNASLVGFGEGASSTVSGPISTPVGPGGVRTPQRQSYIARLAGGKGPRSTDGINYDHDATESTPPATTLEGALHDDEDVRMSDGVDIDGKKQLGNFDFEPKK